MPGRKFRTKIMKRLYEINGLYESFLGCRSNELLKPWGASTNQQIVVEIRMKWHERIYAQMTQWANESNESSIQWISASINDPMSRQINEWMNDMTWNEMSWIELNYWIQLNQWISGSIFNGSVKQWSSQSTTGWWVQKSTNQWIDASMNRRFIQWVNHYSSWVDEPLNQSKRESMNQWFSTPFENCIQWSINHNEPMKQWVDDSVNQWISLHMNRWFSESVNQWTDDSANQGVN